MAHGPLRLLLLLLRPHMLPLAHPASIACAHQPSFRPAVATDLPATPAVPALPAMPAVQQHGFNAVMMGGELLLNRIPGEGSVHYSPPSAQPAAASPPNTPQLPPLGLPGRQPARSAASQPLLTGPCCRLNCPFAVTFYASGWVALWSSLFGVWSGLFYARTGRFIYPFLGGQPAVGW